MSSAFFFYFLNISYPTRIHRTIKRVKVRLTCIGLEKEINLIYETVNFTFEIYIVNAQSEYLGDMVSNGFQI